MPCGLPICVSSNAPGAECSRRDSAASSLSALADRPQACLQAVELIRAGAHLIGEGAVRMGSLPYTASCLLSSFPHSRQDVLRALGGSISAKSPCCPGRHPSAIGNGTASNGTAGPRQRLPGLQAEFSPACAALTLGRQGHPRRLVSHRASDAAPALARRREERSERIRGKGLDLMMP